MVERAAGRTTWTAADDQKLKASHLLPQSRSPRATPTR